MAHCFQFQKDASWVKALHHSMTACIICAKRTSGNALATVCRPMSDACMPAMHVRVIFHPLDLLDARTCGYIVQAQATYLACLLFTCCVNAGVVCALALGQHIQDTQTALLGSRWPTAKAGATYVTLLVAFIAAPELLTLWASLLLLRLQQRKAKCLPQDGSCGPHPHDLEAETSSPGVAAGANGRHNNTALTAVSAAAAAATQSGSSARLTTATDGTLQLQLPAAHKQRAAMYAGSAAAAEAVQPLQRPSDSASCGSTVTGVECGRPPLQQLVSCWLTTLQQLAPLQHSNSSHHKRSCTVYAMGPEPLVQHVQQLCNDVSCLQFVRKTHQL